MTTAALTFGCAFLAFSPPLALLFLLTYSKANLIIVVTTSAFAYLLSTVLSSLFWLPVPSSLQSNPYVLIFPSIVFQFVARAAFVWLYHRVEHSVERSVRRHERVEGRNRAAAAGGGSSNSNNNGDNADGDNADGDNADGDNADGDNADGDNADGDNADGGDSDNDGEPQADSAKLRLELNDWSSALAAGTGFGGMHSFFLYGTLLASESGNLGTLYQPSCEIMPSLVNSAIMAYMFGILDVFWMLFTFYGMRRRRDAGTFESDGGLQPLSSSSSSAGAAAGVGASSNSRGPPGRAGSTVSFADDAMGGSSGIGNLAPYQLGNDKRGGNVGLILVLLSHCAAALSTVPNSTDNGCVVALPCLAVVLLVTALVFKVTCSGHYLPTAQRRRLWERTASMAAEGSRAGRYED
eukprot:CAMPEP_0178674186 /NCGR_PEP_ID=MMETSP0698-20121128/34734_1 /TAXON_ID=265572 /ORGANISM="Extubocellulus spinifer, Strain CCMP396" /LENGTH=408 /DNA_ID=CAMNT_0020318313 /DNA_START=40 /DNA_END=1266 /DNA_ORIENTATION=+